MTEILCIRCGNGEQTDRGIRGKLDHERQIRLRRCKYYKKPEGIRVG